MYWFQKFGFFDYIEFIGMFLAFSDFMRLSERLEKIIGAGRKKLDALLVRNFQRANPVDDNWRFDQETDARNLNTNERTVLVRRTTLTMDHLKVALVSIGLEMGLRTANVRKNYGRCAARIYGFAAIPLAKAAHIISLIILVIIDLILFLISLILHILNKPKVGTIGTISFAVALIGFFGSRLLRP